MLFACFCAPSSYVQRGYLFCPCLNSDGISVNLTQLRGFACEYFCVRAGMSVLQLAEIISSPLNRSKVRTDQPLRFTNDDFNNCRSAKRRQCVWMRGHPDGNKTKLCLNRINVLLPNTHILYKPNLWATSSSEKRPRLWHPPGLLTPGIRC